MATLPVPLDPPRIKTDRWPRSSGVGLNGSFPASTRTPYTVEYTSGMAAASFHDMPGGFGEMAEEAGIFRYCCKEPFPAPLNQLAVDTAHTRFLLTVHVHLHSVDLLTDGPSRVRAGRMDDSGKVGTRHEGFTIPQDHTQLLHRVRGELCPVPMFSVCPD